MFEKLLSDNEAYAVAGAAMAGVLAIIFEIESIIESEFFANGDWPNGYQPNSAIV